MKYGVHEIVLEGNGTVANPFDIVVAVKFVPPSGEQAIKTVHGFYDGGNTWRARVYVSEMGGWRWSSQCATDSQLNGQTGGFSASDSKLRGRLLPHPKNSRQWMTEDGRWFLNLTDTAYFLLSPKDEMGEPIPTEDFQAYVQDAVDHGITSFMSYAVPCPGSDSEEGSSWSENYFADAGFTRLRLENFQNSDRRLRWLLDRHPEVGLQLILFPRGSLWRQDEQWWKNFTPEQKKRIMRYMIARYAAYPQLFWLIVNDAHYAPEKIALPGQADVAGARQHATYPNNIALAREVGAYFKKHDPWQHPLSTGHARRVDFIFADEPWATYIHLENAYDLGATQYAKYHLYGKPVHLGEDYYEQCYPNYQPSDMNYFQRRLFWAWLISGGSATYGGRWWVLHPYRETGRRPTRLRLDTGVTHLFEGRLTGLDSVLFIRDYFTQRGIELSDFEPDHALVKDSDGAEGIRSPKLMRRGHQEFLIYHPNAAADGKDARVDVVKTPGVVVDLSAASGRFAVEWYRVTDGTAQLGGIIGAGKLRTLRSPWHGEDCVVRLRRE